MPIELSYPEFYFYLAFAFIGGVLFTVALLGHPVTDRFIGWVGGIADTEWDADLAAEEEALPLLPPPAAGPSIFDGSQEIDW